MSTDTELEAIPTRTVQDTATLSKSDLIAQVHLIQEVMKSVMQDGQHYGVVPGCGSKPTLLKPGAEKLLMTFRLAPEVEVTQLHGEDDSFVGYRVVCPIRSIHTGVVVGTGVGECSTREEKYAWREAVCDEEYEDADPVERRVKYKKGQGGGHYAVKQVATNPYDQANTILKMAKKRALVDGTLTATAASDIFTQDIEELEHIAGGAPVTKSYTAKSKPASVPCAPPFGRDAGKPLGDLLDESLRWYIECLTQNINDPAKAKFKSKNQEVLQTLMLEIDRRISIEDENPREEDEHSLEGVNDENLGGTHD